MTDDRGAPVVKSADRLMVLFDYLAAQSPATLTQIARDLGIPNSSTYQLLSTATRRGYIALDLEDKVYSLGSRFWEITQASQGDPSIAQLAQEPMDQLRDATQETVQLAQLDGMENVYLAIAESPLPMKLVSQVGSRLPAHATGLGKTLLAYLDRDELHRRLGNSDLAAMTENTITDRQELETELDLIRSRGCGEDREEYLVGCRCVAMPIRDRNDNVVAALSVSVPTPRFTPRLERTIHTELRQTIHALEKKLGRVASDAAGTPAIVSANT
jgi:IclR family KDG regulon transcriptional repressor